MFNDLAFMRAALKEAYKAKRLNEVPVGAVIVQNNKIISSAHNITEKRRNSILHAEIIAISKACKKLGEKYLGDCSIYITLKPCAMCMAAIKIARISKVFYGAEDNPGFAKNGVHYNPTGPNYNHNLEIYSGIMYQESINLLNDFFNTLRNKNIQN